MNKFPSILFCFIISLFVACTVSEEEKAADLQRHRDSVAAAEAMIRSAELANESRDNALKSINQEALKNDTLIRKDSIFKANKDTGAVVKNDSAASKKWIPSKPKTEVKPAIKKVEQPKTTEKKKVTVVVKSSPKKTDQKK